MGSLSLKSPIEILTDDLAKPNFVDDVAYIGYINDSNDENNISIYVTLGTENRGGDVGNAIDQLSKHRASFPDKWNNALGSIPDLILIGQDMSKVLKGYKVLVGATGDIVYIYRGSYVVAHYVPKDYKWYIITEGIYI